MHMFQILHFGLRKGLPRPSAQNFGPRPGEGREGHRGRRGAAGGLAEIEQIREGLGGRLGRLGRSGVVKRH